MYTNIISFILKNTRPEFHGAAMVIIYGGSYMAAFLILMLGFSLFGIEFGINYEFCGYLVGCIGAGEIARGFCKLNFPPFNAKNYYLAVSLAGYFTVSIFYLLMVFKWGHQIYGIAIAGVVGALFYNLLVWLQKLENRKNS